MDPHERSWYDNHRDSILRGDDGTAGTGGGEFGDLVDLFPYFRSSCYSGFGERKNTKRKSSGAGKTSGDEDDADDPGDFYTVYGAIFDEIG